MTHHLPGGTLRVGVTGTRQLADVEQPHVREQVADVLRVIAGTKGPGGRQPVLRLLSPLAEGADRMVADLAKDYELVCPLPFPQTVYEQDFKTLGSIDQFRRLLGQAEGRVLEMDGQRGDDEARSYGAVGRLIVRNCDLIIGLWDGRAGRGHGGTAEIIRYAAGFGPPVIWINVADPNSKPRWIEEVHDSRRGAKLRPAAEALWVYLNRVLLEPEPHEHLHQSWLHSGCHFVQTLVGGAIRCAKGLPKPTPLSTFLAEKKRCIYPHWKMNQWFMAAMAWNPCGAAAKPPKVAPPRPAEAQRWADLLDAPDNRANEYAARHRSSYVWAFLLAGVALTAAAVALGFAHDLTVKSIATGTELATLALIACLVIADSVCGWQTKAIEYRLLAELCRKQKALAPLGGVVPRASAWATAAAYPHPEHDKPFIEPVSWVSWTFSAWLRDTPLPIGTIDAARVKTARDSSLHDLIGDQIRYHEKRCVQSYRAGRLLVRIGEILFAIVFGLVGYKFWLLMRDTPEQIEAMHESLTWFGLAGVALPAFSAAVVGIRAYAELEILAEQSAAMLAELTQAEKQIGELDDAAPLASQTLGVALARVATLMLEDLEGWARLFRGKVLDA
jgi:hypothetical protein